MRESKGSVRKRGSKWYYYFDAKAIDGKRRKIERVGGYTRKEALIALEQALEEYNLTGDFPEARKKSVSKTYDTPKGLMSFEAFSEYWFKEYVELNCKYHTKVNYSNMLKRHAIPKLGMYKLNQLTPLIIQNYLNDLCREGFAKSTVINHKGLLSGMLKYAIYPCQFIKENPVIFTVIPNFDKLPHSKESLKIITIEEYQRILRKFPQGNKMNLPVQIAFHTGLRAAEVCGLTWDNIDLEERTITVDKILITKEKGNSELQSPKTFASYRTIAIGDTLVEILKKEKRQQMENKLKYNDFFKVEVNRIDYKEYLNAKKFGFVCTSSKGVVVTTNHIKTLCHEIKNNLNINFTFHSLRHTHATMLLSAGANMKDVQERLGHSKFSTTMDTYAHVTQKMKRESVNIFESEVCAELKKPIDNGKYIKRGPINLLEYMYKEI